MRSKYISLLRNRDFAMLWIGQAVSQLGSSIFNISLVWFITDLTGSAISVANVMTLAATSIILSSAFAGVIVDRFDRRKIMLTSDLVRAVVVFIFAFIAFQQKIEIWHFYVLAVIFGLVGALFAPAGMSVLPAIVDKNDLVAANSISTSTLIAINILGPAVGGMLISLPGVGISGISFFNAVSFLAGALGIWSIRSAVVRQERHSGQSFVKELTAGLGYLRSYPSLLSLIKFFAFLNLAAAPVFVLLPLFAKDVLKAGVAGFGFMEGGLCAGMLIGSFFAGATGNRFKRVPYILGVCIIQGLLLATLSLSPGIKTAVTILFLYGAVNALISTMFISLLQEKVEDEFRGRVFSLVSLASTGLQPVSMALSGVMAERFGLLPVMAMSGLGLTALAACGFLLKGLRDLR